MGRTIRFTDVLKSVRKDYAKAQQVFKDKRRESRVNAKARLKRQVDTNGEKG